MCKENPKTQKFPEDMNNPQYWQYWYNHWKETPMLADSNNMSVEEAEKYDQFLQTKAEEAAKAHFLEEKLQHNDFEWTYRHNRNGEQYYQLIIERNELAVIQPGEDTVYEILVKEYGTELYIVYEEDCSLSEALDISGKGAEEYLAKCKDHQGVDDKIFANYETPTYADRLEENSIEDKDHQLSLDFGEEMDME